ncbi:GrpB family protein [Cryobacterium zhongshanensis]|uniref:GrpB family protein n=1 Tax=Cryobacterium zhongshanensis TaxID=2928153 RepID=A0AA41UJ82_9MICO|nr:GrpB family protein [Cryobacterium zhongshanensis]MCI4656706.1 GrpB family protein [Cryobacterium zhongshanensis]
MTMDCVPRRPDVVTVELVGGSEKRELKLVAYDERWPVIFRAHRNRLRKALGTTGVEVEHIGSTSVPGLAAKPIIDILVTVGDITAEEDYLAPLLSVGYELRAREPGHRLVRTSARDVHIHILQSGDPAIDRYLLFRNRLRADADDRSLYEATKSALLSDGFDDMNAYAEAKTDVIEAIIARALASGT